MTSPYCGQGESGALKGADDFARAVLLTELLSDHLPRLPWFLRNLQCQLEDSSTALDKVCAALETNPSICANFIRMGSLAEPIQPILLPVDHLVIMLGKQRVWTTAVAAYLLHELGGSWATEAKRDLAAMAMKRADQALALARRAETEALEQAYVSGVLSVIGLLPLLDAGGLDGHGPEWVAISVDGARRQREIFGTDFLELDRWVRLLWRLPLEPLGTEVTSESLPCFSTAAILPKNNCSSQPAETAGPGTRNLVLVPKGRV